MRTSTRDHGGPCPGRAVLQSDGTSRNCAGSLQRLTASPLSIGWYLRMDPQIEALCGTADHAANLVNDVVRSENGDYLGLHVHATYWDEDAARWVSARDRPELWLEHLSVGLDAFAARMVGPPLRHRFSLGLMSDPMMALLGEAGVQVDLTPEPRPGPSTFVRVPRGAYQTTGRPPVTVPPGSSTRFPPGGPAWRHRARRVRWPFARWYVNPYGGQTPTAFWDEVARSVVNMARPYVSFGLRTNARGGWADLRQRALLEALVTHPLAGTLRFADPLELVPTAIRPRTSGWVPVHEKEHG